MNKFESKYFNTALVMNEALIDLLDKKEYEFISVKELCDKAGVNRSTFYLHYEKMDDLLEETISYLNKNFKEQFSNTELSKKTLKQLTLKQKMFITPEYLTPLLIFMKNNKKIFKLYKKIPHILNTNKAYDEVKDGVIDIILSDYNIPEEDRKYYTSFYFTGLFSIIFTWLDNDCKESIDKIILIIMSLVGVVKN